MQIKPKPLDRFTLPYQPALKLILVRGSIKHPQNCHFSDFLKKQLDDHLASNYNGKVKVVHAKKREGLIRTRLLGAKHATGEVLIFLDSHVEANINWLPPLIGE